MKYILIILLAVISFNSYSQTNTVNKTLEQRLKREIPNAKIGDLICLDDFGNHILCSGNEFEKILGFCTNTPYITVNKAKGDNKITEFVGVASFEKGKIKTGNYLCASKKYPGKVMRCRKKQNPYAKALESPKKEDTLFKVKILGNKRKY